MELSFKPDKAARSFPFVSMTTLQGLFRENFSVASAGPKAGPTGESRRMSPDWQRFDATSSKT